MALQPTFRRVVPFAIIQGGLLISYDTSKYGVSQRVQEAPRLTKLRGRWRACQGKLGVHVLGKTRVSEKVFDSGAC